MGNEEVEKVRLYSDPLIQLKVSGKVVATR